MKEVNITLQNMGTTNKNCVTISTKNGSVNLYFSYKTLVAVDGTVSKNEWSNTTGKLLNELDGGHKKERVSHAEVLKKAQKRIQEVLY